ncbi:Dynamin-related protein 3B [Vitis vinifera]|uniref:Dynamin-related protein 3B n=1 Tax=Vitis vinifera TaxID=29760 RepID=A0A438I328_VITVI|nr:Dynamin-related protein 3B [Vitis vinifera]
MADETISSTPSAVPLSHSVIPIVNRLQSVFAWLSCRSMIELPQVAFVGCQGSGKSSIIEAMVGRDFLLRVKTFVLVVRWFCSSCRQSKSRMGLTRSMVSSYTCLGRSSLISRRSTAKFR